MVVRFMSNASQNLPDDPALLKAMIAALEAKNAKMSAILQAHHQLIQSLRLRIARVKKHGFGNSLEKIEREIQQLELALEDLMIATSVSGISPRSRKRSLACLRQECLKRLCAAVRVCRTSPLASEGNSILARLAVANFRLSVKTLAKSRT